MKNSPSFCEMNSDQLKVIISEFLALDLEGLPEFGTRDWYVTKCCLWITGQLLDGHNPLRE